MATIATERKAQTLPPAALRHFYGYRNGVPDDALYLSGGRADCQSLFSSLEELRLLPSSKLLDFGCGSGRMTRHMREFTQAEIWGCDIHAEAILWADQHLKQEGFRFFTTTTAPHLPFRDDTFDVVFAGSVFTHTDELHTAWLLELSRITAKTGCLCLSFSHEGTQLHLKSARPEHPSHDALRLHRARQPRAHFLHGTTPWSLRRLNHFQSFIEELSDLFHLLRLREFGYGWQCLAILKPR